VQPFVCHTRLLGGADVVAVSGPPLRMWLCGSTRMMRPRGPPGLKRPRHGSERATRDRRGRGAHPCRGSIGGGEAVYWSFFAFPKKTLGACSLRPGRQSRLGLCTSGRFSQGCVSLFFGRVLTKLPRTPPGPGFSAHLDARCPVWGVLPSMLDALVLQPLSLGPCCGLSFPPAVRYCGVGGGCGTGRLQHQVAQPLPPPPPPPLDGSPRRLPCG